MLLYPPHPDTPVTATCAATYYADRIPAFAFTFRVASTETRFTVYASTSDRYHIGDTYRLSLAGHGELLLALTSEQWAFLRHCLDITEQRWRDAIAEADAGAARPESPPAASDADHLNAEPTPAGYRTIAQRFRDELDRVTDLKKRIGPLLDTGQDGAPS
ncbi:MAG TPA: hypothetical protein VF755_04675 [Catenuloplanes sp.]